MSKMNFQNQTGQPEILKKSFQSLFTAYRDNEILKYVLRSLWSMRKLSREYSSLLEENVSDENYEKVMDSYAEIAKHYAFVPRNLSHKEIAYSAKLILDTLDENLGSDDIADLLELDVMNVENALTQYSQR